MRCLKYMLAIIRGNSKIKKITNEATPSCHDSLVYFPPLMKTKYRPPSNVPSSCLRSIKSATKLHKAQSSAANIQKSGRFKCICPLSTDTEVGRTYSLNDCDWRLDE